MVKCTTTPAVSQSEIIKRIAGHANAVTALLEVFDIVPPAEQADIVAVAGSIANDIARDLATFIGSQA